MFFQHFMPMLRMVCPPQINLPKTSIVPENSPSRKETSTQELYQFSAEYAPNLQQQIPARKCWSWSSRPEKDGIHGLSTFLRKSATTLRKFRPVMCRTVSISLSHRSNCPDVASTCRVRSEGCCPALAWICFLGYCF